MGAVDNEKRKNIVVIKNLYKNYESHNLFQNFNLEIKEGEFIILSGVSGSGKTTLLNMIGGLESFDNGEILVDGIDISKRKNKISYFSKKVGFVFQNFALIEEKTVRQNLEIVQMKNRTKISIEKALELVGVREKIDSLVYTLSGGEQQRVALARLLVKKCAIILADEPTGSLDHKNAEAVIKILKILNNYGKTVLLVTHDESLKQVGDRVINL